MVTTQLEIYNGPQITAACKRAIETPFSGRLVLHQGGPGIGKTHHIVEAIRPEDIALAVGRRNADSTRDRINKRHPDFPDRFSRVRTVDSFLMRPNARAENVHVDEVFNEHPGKVFAALSLAGAVTAELQGDVYQIPFVNRSELGLLYGRPSYFHEVRYHHLSRRCPADALFAIGQAYRYTMRTVSDSKKTLSVEVMPPERVMPDKRFKNIVFYQADKEYFKKLVPTQEYGTIDTVNEVQGETYDCVRLLKSAAKVQPLNKDEAQVIVALSRHKKQFVYCTPLRNPDDLVVKWVEAAQRNMRYVDAMRNQSTAGRSVYDVA